MTNDILQKKVYARHNLIPYTIKNSPEPQKSVLYDMWARPRNKNNTFCTVTGSTGCVDCETEFLTPLGWKSIADYEDGDIVMQYNPETKEGYFIKPLDYIKLPEKKMYLIETKYGLNQCLSSEHTVAYRSFKTKKFKTNTMKEVYDQHNINKYGFGGSFIVNFLKDNFNSHPDSYPYYYLSNSDYKLIVAIICDGSISVRKNGLKYIRFNLKKQRKIVRLLSLLNSLNIKYKLFKKDNGFTQIYFHYSLAIKTFDLSWYGLNYDQLKLMADESLMWDGNCKSLFSSTIKENADFIQYCFVATSRKASISIDNRIGRVRNYKSKDYTTTSICYNVIVSQKHSNPTIKKGAGDKPKIKIIKPKDGYKYCFTVATGFLILRRNNCVFITGNSGKSYGNIYFGYMLDVDNHDNHLFTEDNIIFDPLDFVNKVSKPRRIGEFFMKDEIQLDAHARKSFSKINEVLGNVMSTIRYKREIIFLNLPSETQLDSQIRLLRYGNFEFTGVDSTGICSYFNFEYLNYPKKADTTNLKDKKVKRDPLVVWNDDAYVTLQHYQELSLELPFHKKDFVRLLKIYDKKKDEYLLGKYAKFKKDLEQVVNSTSTEEKPLDYYLTYIDKHKSNFMPKDGKKLSLANIQRQFKITLTLAKLIRAEYHNTYSVNKKESKKERSAFVESLTRKKNKLMNI
jgi:hypothetical protein